MGLARSTVQQRVSLPHDVGLLVSGPASIGSRSRFAALTAFNPHAGLVLAAHIGLTGTRLAAADLNGELLLDRLVRTPLATGPAGLAAGVLRGFDGVLDALESRPPIVRIGI